MMQSELYLTIIVMAVAGLWFVWDLGLKKLFLDGFRERLFELRFQLFKMGESGELSFDDEAYRAIETLICGLLRFGHRVTFMGFILSMREQALAKKSDDYVDYSKQIELKISRTPPDVQSQLRKILSDVHSMVTIYMAVSSLLFMVASVVLALLRGLNLFRNFGKREISSVLESEAYRAESYRGRRAQTAAAF
jgi:hypothetical protein